MNNFEHDCFKRSVNKTTLKLNISILDYLCYSINSWSLINHEQICQSISISPQKQDTYINIQLGCENFEDNCMQRRTRCLAAAIPQGASTEAHLDLLDLQIT